MSSAHIIIFYVFAAVAIIGALGVLLMRNVLYAAFMLILSFFAVAALYVYAQAGFIAVTQILVYVGGILVLLIFALMLTRKIDAGAMMVQSHNKFVGIALGAATFALFLVPLLQINFSALGYNQTPEQSPQAAIPAIGISIMTENVVALELAAVLLLIALIGAAVLSTQKKGGENDSH